MKKLKQKIYNIIREDDENSLIAQIFDSIIIALIIINVIAVIVDTFSLPSWISPILNALEIISVVVFSVEYVLRVWTADEMYPELTTFRAMIKYMFSFMAVIDLLAILPFYIPVLIPVDLRVLRALRIFRILRIFKVNRYTDALTSIGDVLKSKKSQLLSSLLVVMLLMIMAAVIMYNVESDAQPEAFNNAFDALWWAVATFTTVGYGDIYPVTVIGKILSEIIALLGIGLVAVPTGIISAGFIEQIDPKNNANGAKKIKSVNPSAVKNDLINLLSTASDEDVKRLRDYAEFLKFKNYK